MSSDEVKALTDSMADSSLGPLNAEHEEPSAPTDKAESSAPSKETGSIRLFVGDISPQTTEVS